MELEEFLLDRAKKEGTKESTVTFIKTLLLETSFSTEKIADLVGVSEDFVTEVKSKMKA